MFIIWLVLMLTCLMQGECWLTGVFLLLALSSLGKIITQGRMRPDNGRSASYLIRRIL